MVSRRSKGVSIGINLNPDKLCNFDCVYCQVDRTTPGPTNVVDLERLREELDDMLDQVTSGALFQAPQFRGTPEPLRRLNDIAFSGDGEPTTCPEFAEIVQRVAEIKQRRAIHEVKLVLITNASMFQRAPVKEALAVLNTSNGEVWAKLEAGTEDYYRRVDRSTIPFRRILDNITALGSIRYGFPTHYFDAWDALFQGTGPTGDMLRGTLLQIPYALVFLGIGWWYFRRKDILS